MIETNQLAQKSIPATFMRGYVRSYAKFLKLPESVWVHASFGEDHKNDLGKMHVQPERLTIIPRITTGLVG